MLRLAGHKLALDQAATHAWPLHLQRHLQVRMVEEYVSLSLSLPFFLSVFGNVLIPKPCQDAGSGRRVEKGPLPGTLSPDAVVRKASARETGVSQPLHRRGLPAASFLPSSSSPLSGSSAFASSTSAAGGGLLGGPSTRLVRSSVLGAPSVYGGGAYRSSPYAAASPQFGGSATGTPFSAWLGSPNSPLQAVSGTPLSSSSHSLSQTRGANMSMVGSPLSTSGLDSLCIWGGVGAGF